MKEESAKFLINEIESYCSNRFGSMTKNDFEVLIFKALLEDGLKNKSNYHISRILHIPESKVKRLKYEADLKYTKSSEYEDEKFKELDSILKKSVWKGSTAKIQLSIEDLSLRKFLDHILKTHYSFSDSSFNSEIVTISSSDLELIFSSYEDGKKVIDEFNNITQKIVNSYPSIVKPTFKELLPEIILELSKTTSGIAKSMEGIINLSPLNLIEKIGEKFVSQLPYFKNKK